jgi:hypothetical protein
VRRGHRWSRRPDQIRPDMRRLAHARLDGCFGNRRCVGRRGLLDCPGRRPSRGRSGSCGSRLGHRRGAFRARRFRYRRRSNVCDGRRPGGRGRYARRQQRQGIDVTLRIARDASTEVHVRIGQVDDAARTDRPHHGRFSHEGAARHSDRPEMDERDRVPGRRLDRDGLAAGRHRPGKRNHSLRRGEHRAAARRAKVDTAVLATGVRVGVVERKRP